MSRKPKKKSDKGLGTGLRRMLCAIKPTGEDGFEGLLAHALAAFSGLTFRLAKSGSQYGRDGSSPIGPFAIALEAKRYDDNLRLEDLAGKAVVAGYSLEGQADVWALGATSEVGEGTLAKLTEILESSGITLLAFDWADRPLPPMAVLLAATKTSTLAWFHRYLPRTSISAIEAQLEEIVAHPSYGEQVNLLRDSVNGANVGIDALRRHCGDWLRKRLANPRLSQLAFGQYIAVADSSSPAEPRGALTEQLRCLAVAKATDLAMIAVLGGEGVGKTWLVAQWWLNLPDQPIPIIVAGRRAECLIAGEPLESLARMLAWQLGNSDDKSISIWRRRLQRWKGQRAESHLRFVVVLDGINEHASIPWADLIRELAREVQALGGLLIVTCREGFWGREVLPRLRGSIEVREVIVGGYSDQELAAVLRRSNMALVDISPRVREFLRNPRICNVALSLVGRLSLQPSELTVERLLVEYWQFRLRERGSLLAHTVVDFDNMLRSHAKAWREQPKRRFYRDDWTSHSGVARRLDLSRLQNDLTEIEEGRFLQIAPDDSGVYEFRHEVLPYALGLLINAEIREELRRSNADANEQLEKILDTIRGFDLVAEIIAAAVGLACLDDGFPSQGRGALVDVWLGLQNIDDAAVEAMAGYVPVRPEAFLDAAEVTRTGEPAHYDFLLDLLVHKRDHPTVTCPNSRGRRPLRSSRLVAAESRHSDVGQSALRRST